MFDVEISSHLTVFDTSPCQLLDWIKDTPATRKPKVSLGKLVFDTESPIS